MSREQKIRSPLVAGMFYPQKSMTLEREVALLLENSPEKKISGRLISIIVPHAGYIYSGGVAARAYRQIMERNIDTVVVISPSHREYFKEVPIYDGYGYSTPLGVIPIDQAIAQKLSDYNPKIILSEKGHRFDEHALEVQLPFLQKQNVNIQCFSCRDHSKMSHSCCLHDLVSFHRVIHPLRMK